MESYTSFDGCTVIRDLYSIDLQVCQTHQSPVESTDIHQYVNPFGSLFSLIGILARIPPFFRNVFLDPKIHQDPLVPRSD
jgi:hypothetical protein